MKRNPVIGLIAAMLLCLSCSVKEDREPCPCWLGIDLQQCGSIHDNRLGQDITFSAMDVVISAWNDGFLFQQKVGHEDYGQLYEKAVPKSYVSTSVVHGEKTMRRDGQELVIPEGKEADPIFAYAAQVGCFQEFARDTARLHKQFARVRMKVENPVGESYPYRFRLRSDTKGLDLMDLRPLEGPAGMDLERGTDDIVRFRLIRQREEGYTYIDVFNRETLLESFPLHEWIKELGYSWLAKDLQDIDINIDYAQGEVSVKVNDWGDGGSIRIEI